MNKFIKQTLTFILVSILLIVSIMLVSGYLIKIKGRFPVNKKASILLLGHSHTECAFNDNLITDLKNYSHSAEPYFYTYQKLRKIAAQNPQLKTVFIEYSNNQIVEKMDDWTWGYQYMSSMFPQYAAFMDKSDISLILEHNSKDFLNCLSLATRENLFRIFTFNYDFSSAMGGYLRLDHEQPNLNNLNNNVKSELDATSFRISAVNIQYLQKIIAYCNDKHLQVFLVRSPQHNKYEYLKNEADLFKIKQHYFPNTEFLDFNKFPLADHEFADPGHLNYKGALKFSVYVNQILSSGLLGMHDKQNFIDETIHKINLKLKNKVASL
jgi:hypothetical protein